MVSSLKFCHLRSCEGDSWGHFSHDQSRSRAYRWGEDGILGFTDRGISISISLNDLECRLCFGIAVWNEKDPILKERLFGLTGPQVTINSVLFDVQGNHGEDVKEHYFYLESTPTHSYVKGLYKYPQV